MSRLSFFTLDQLNARMLIIAALLTTSLFGFGQTKDQSHLTVTLLHEADILSRPFAPEERAELLLTMAQTAAPFDAARAKSWSLELFRITTEQLRHGMYREAMQKDALVTLAQNDPILAAKLYKQQDIPNISDDPKMLEDTRSFGARTLFPALWGREGPAAITTIESLADYLGSTGQYPYHAMADIIVRLSEKEKSKATALFSQAVSCLPRDPGFADTNREYVDFLVKTHKVATAALLQQALSEAFASIDKAEAKQQFARHYEVSTQKGSVEFNSDREFLTFRLLPIVKQFDPDWAERLKQQYPSLRMSPSVEIGDNPTVAASMSNDPNESPAAMKEAADEHRLIQLTEIGVADPKRAAEIARSISNPDMRTIGLASIAPGYAKVDNNTAESWLKYANGQLETMKDEGNRLQLLLALAKAAFAEHHEQEGLDFTMKAIDLGEELFARDERANPGKMAYETTGEQEVVEIVTVACEKLPRPVSILDRVHKIRSSALQVHALVAAAKGVLNNKTAFNQTRAARNGRGEDGQRISYSRREY